MDPAPRSNEANERDGMNGPVGSTMSAYAACPLTVSGAVGVSPLCTQVRPQARWVEQVRAQRLRERLLGHLRDQLGEQLVVEVVVERPDRRRRPTGVRPRAGWPALR